MLDVKVGAVATPLELVVTVAVGPLPGAAKDPLAPLAGAVKVTETPETPLALLSVTVTASAAKAVFTATLCELPPAMMIFEAGPGKLVNEKAALAVTPVTAAFTVYTPAVVFAVNTGEVATPLALVVTVAVAPVPGAANVPLATLEGAVNVTVALFTGLPPLSFTVACKTANAVLIVTLCGVPDVAVIEAAGPVRFVRLKLTETVPAVACTL